MTSALRRTRKLTASVPKVIFMSSSSAARSPAQRTAHCRPELMWIKVLQLRTTAHVPERDAARGCSAEPGPIDATNGPRLSSASLVLRCVRGTHASAQIVSRDRQYLGRVRTRDEVSAVRQYAPYRPRHALAERLVDGVRHGRIGRPLPQVNRPADRS